MLKYIKKYFPLALIAAAFLLGDVLTDLILPTLMSIIVDDGILGINSGAGDLKIVWDFGLKMIFISLIGAALGIFSNIFLFTVSQNIGNDLRKDTFAKIMTFSFDRIDNFTTGSLITRITNDISQIQRLTSQMIRILTRTSMMMIGSLFFVFNLNKKFAVIMFLAFPLIFIIIIVCLRSANPLFSKLQKELDEINNILQEDISGIRIIKAFVREIYEKIRFSKANDELIKTQMKVIVILSIMSPAMNVVMYLVIATILLVGSIEVSAGAATPGEIMATITYTTQVLGGMLIIAMLFQNISRGIVSWKRINEVLRDKPTLTDGNLGIEEIPEKNSETGTVEFKNVSFSYPESKKVVLKNINLKINSGETVAIMGATGSGKTTLISLIPRFYDAVEGEVLVNGRNVKEYNLHFLRDKVSIALQKSELFSTSAAKNISWGNLNADFEMIENAAKIALADEFIKKLENGYETHVLERGMRLSGGQKQRIALARAVLKPAEILIFDDATSALDLKTEADFFKALKEAKPNVTKIIVAQRAASVRSVDKIVVLDKSEICSIGKHEELIKTCKIYREIYESQMGDSGDLI